MTLFLWANYWVLRARRWWLIHQWGIDADLLHRPIKPRLLRKRRR